MLAARATPAPETVTALGGTRAREVAPRQSIRLDDSDDSDDGEPARATVATTEPAKPTASKKPRPKPRPNPSSSDKSGPLVSLKTAARSVPKATGNAPSKAPAKKAPSEKTSAKKPSAKKSPTKKPPAKTAQRKRHKSRRRWKSDTEPIADDEVAAYREQGRIACAYGVTTAEFTKFYEGESFDDGEKHSLDRRWKQHAAGKKGVAAKVTCKWQGDVKPYVAVAPFLCAREAKQFERRWKSECRRQNCKKGRVTLRREAFIANVVDPKGLRKSQMALHKRLKALAITLSARPMWSSKALGEAHPLQIGRKLHVIAIGFDPSDLGVDLARLPQKRLGPALECLSTANVAEALEAIAAIRVASLAETADAE